MLPKKIKAKDGKLSIVFPDCEPIEIGLKYLRDECPCASCKGETILWKTYRPQQLTVFHPEMYKIASIKMVGDYAIQIDWKDGHNTGLYSWEYLEKLSADQDSGIEQKYDPLL